MISLMLLYIGGLRSLSKKYTILVIYEGELLVFNLYTLLAIMMKYKCKVKSSRPSLYETQDKRSLGRDSDRSLCHRHTTSMIKLFWSQPMTPWASRAVYGQGEKFLA